MNELGQFLSDELNKRGISASKLARMADLSGNTVHDIIRGTDKDIRIGTLIAIAKALDIHPWELMSRAGTMPDNVIPIPKPVKSVAINEQNFVQIPLRGSVSASQFFTEQGIMEMILMPRTIMPHPADFAVKAQGDCLENSDYHIMDGDIVFLNRSGSIKNGQLGCFINAEGEITLKIYKKVGNQPILLNGDGDMIPYGNELKIIGVYVGRFTPG